MNCPVCSHDTQAAVRNDNAQGIYKCGSCGVLWTMADTMDCPVCSDNTRVEVNMKADGFAQSMFECGHCGALWALRGNVNVLLHDALYHA
jgi:uncharacterized Zn finger protein